MSQIAPGRTTSTREAPMFGRYRMLGRIAAGGMAEVWAAQLLAPGGFCKSMVIKRVLPELAENPSFLRMLMTEARVAARLSHTNICAVFELGEVDGEYYIAMEYLRGVPLTHLLKAGGGLDPAAAVAIVAQACDGLHYAHEQRDASGGLLGLVHRDVSPHNLFVTVDGIVKVLDFGIAKVDDGSSERTEAGKVKGKLAYMSPEQLAADSLDRRSDVWSLGCVLWELLTGRRLFAGGPAQTVDAIRNARVPALAAAGVDQPQLDDVIARAICKSREWRYATAADLRRAMVDALAPSPPVQNDALSQLVWARCGAEIRAHDRRFEGTEDDSTLVEDDPSVVSRLPLRAGNTTQVSQEVYVQDGVDTPGLSEVLARLDRGPAAESRADTSPDLPSNRAAVEEPDAESLRPKRRGLVFGLIGAAAVLGMVVGVVTRGGSEEPQAKKDDVVAAIEAPTPAPAPQPTPDVEAIPRPEPEPVPVVAPAPEPAPEPDPPPVITKKPPKKAPKEKVAKEKVREKEKPVAVARPGKLYVNAQPWATIYLDGKKLGPTPIIGHTLDAGDHTIKAVTSDGRTKSMRIKVDSGGTVRKKVTW